ncbi:uncharacterized protein LOC129755723 [Uranotaenia lowii]|uniref:uncharacterized protein LOC129755723 n=1 Tax=Uranotaenia lowii TaxID=190385 RepID=UPI0024785362|nr:uncharacterized protein LOC129755723 [Uranotaenia lowii]XP_055608330.1 uncharacterized protein LOC129755723 [Uranotaenia lowii]
MVMRESSDNEGAMSSDDAGPSGSGHRNRQRTSEEFSDFVNYLMERGTLYFNQFMVLLNHIVTRYRVKDKVMVVFDGLKKHPLLALSIAGILFILMLPFVIFIFFTLATAVMTFTGFVLIEGTLITVASMLLVGVLACIFALLGFVALVFLAGYFGLSKAVDFFERSTSADVNPAPRVIPLGLTRERRTNRPSNEAH